MRRRLGFVKGNQLILNRNIAVATEAMAQVVGWFLGGGRPWDWFASGRSCDVLVGLAAWRVAPRMGCLLRLGRPWGRVAPRVGCLLGWARPWDGSRSWDVLVELAPFGGFELAMNCILGPYRGVSGVPVEGEGRGRVRCPYRAWGWGGVSGTPIGPGC